MVGKEGAHYKDCGEYDHRDIPLSLSDILTDPLSVCLSVSLTHTLKSKQQLVMPFIPLA